MKVLLLLLAVALASSSAEPSKPVAGVKTEAAIPIASELTSGEGKLHPSNCYMYNTDIDGDDMNNGLADKVDSAVACVNLCLAKYPGAQYFTWSDNNLADPNYRRSCWCTPNNRGSASSPNTVAGPLFCGSNDGPGCCNTVRLTSDGGIANSGQSSILGTYAIYSQGTNGRYNYIQQGLGNHYLYYLDSLQIWFIGDTIGSNVGYASNPGAAACLEDVHKIWDYYSPAVQDWVLDYSARTDCV